jgi:hypothetical protein
MLIGQPRRRHADCGNGALQPTFQVKHHFQHIDPPGRIAVVVGRHVMLFQNGPVFVDDDPFYVGAAKVYSNDMHS